jgi:hypothetical protein
MSFRSWNGSKCTRSGGWRNAAGELRWWLIDRIAPDSQGGKVVIKTTSGRTIFARGLEKGMTFLFTICPMSTLPNESQCEDENCPIKGEKEQ